jgi:hypothetical protein
VCFGDQGLVPSKLSHNLPPKPYYFMMAALVASNLKGIAYGQIESKAEGLHLL